MRKGILILIGVLVLIGFVSVCLAQDTEKGESSKAEGKTETKVTKKTKADTLEPVVVTASRIEKSLSEVPANVSVVTAQDIEDSNANGIPDALKDLEGVYTYDASGVGTSGRVNMRGFWGGMSTYQLVLIDGIPQNNVNDKLIDWSLIPLDDIERIEVLRGPVSALYGDDAMAGVINIITKKPTRKPETKLYASYGSYNTQNYNVATSGTFFNRLGYYFGIGSKITDGFRRCSDYKNIHLGGKVDLEINEWNSLSVASGYQAKKTGPHPWALTETQVLADRRQPRPGTEDDENCTEKAEVSMTYHVDIGDISEIEVTPFYRYRDSSSFYTSGALQTTTTEQLRDENVYGLIVRGSVKPELLWMTHTISAGIDMEKDDFDYEEYQAPFHFRGVIRTNYKVKRKKFGPYIQDEIRVFDPLRVVGGIRYDSVKFDHTNRIGGWNSNKRDMSKESMNGGIVLDYMQDCNLYLNYGQAFRTPTIGQMFTYGTFSNPDLEPERATNYEVGVRHWFGDFLRANVSLYWMDVKEEIWYDAALRRYENLGKTSHKGIESGINFRLFDFLTGFVNYTYTRAKNKSGDFSGRYLTNVPIHKGSFGVKFETDFGLKAVLSGTRVSTTYMDSANENKLSGYCTLDTRVSYEHKWFSVFFAVDNLTNAKYDSYGYISRGSKRFNPAPRATFTFGGNAKF